MIRVSRPSILVNLADKDPDPPPPPPPPRILTVREKWQKCIRLVIAQIAIVEAWRSVNDFPYMIVRTDRTVETMFKEIREYLRYKKRQDLYSIVVGPCGKDISRKGELSLLAFSTLEGKTWIIDVKTLRETFWGLTTVREFLTDPQIEKIVFDGRHFSDYLLNVHGLEFRGMCDLMVLEAMERTRLTTLRDLPGRFVEDPGKSSKKRFKADRRLFLDMETIAECYIGKRYSCYKNLSGKMWATRQRGTIAEPDKVEIQWVLDYQKFMVQFHGKFNFLKAIKNNKYIRWWVSSERFCALLSEKSEREYDEIENSSYIPGNILCLKSHELPLGIFRCLKCSRYLPSKEYTFEMVSRPAMAPKMCKMCLIVVHKLVTRTGYVVNVKNVKLGSLKLPPDVVKKWRETKSESESGPEQQTTAIQEKRSSLPDSTCDIDLSTISIVTQR